MAAGILAFLPMQQKSAACTGSRQIAMGSTGVTIAENSHASYWNCGIIPFLDNSEISYTRAFGDTDRFRYDSVACLTFPFEVSGCNLGLGLHYADSSTKKEAEEYFKEQDNKWLKLGFGIGKSKGEWDYGLGNSIISGEEHYFRKNSNGEYLVEGARYDAELSFIIRKHNTFSNGDLLRLGALYRRFWINDEELEGSEGLRPEISYTFQNRLGEATTALGYYGLTGSENNGDNGGIRFGVEQRIGKNISLRAGYTDYDHNDPSSRRKDIKIGLGLEGRRGGFDISYSKEDYGLAGIFFKF